MVVVSAVVTCFFFLVGGRQDLLKAGRNVAIVSLSNYKVSKISPLSTCIILFSATKIFYISFSCLKFYFQKHDTKKEISSFVVLEIHVAPSPDTKKAGNGDTNQKYRIFSHSRENKVRLVITAKYII